MDYCLAPDVHACLSGDLIVFLDLKRDRYFAAPGGAFALDIPARRLRACNEEARLWGAKLLAQALVLESVAVVATPTLGFAATRLWPKAPAFAAALLWARSAVNKPFALRGALAELSARRRHAPHDIPRARAEAALFASWRPLWPHPFICLNDTLALAWFLSARRAACDIVFGVQARPFAAHCWVETGGEVLNDEAEYCASFDVILRA
jgi:hypothetical protein